MTSTDPRAVLTREAWEQARVVDEDLCYLIDDWRPEVDEPSLRRDSPLLRRLLVEGQYGRAWRDLGLPGEPYLSAPTLAAWLGQTTPAFVQYAVVPPTARISATLTAQGGQVQMGVLQDVPTGSVVALAGAYGNGTGLLLVVVPPDEVAEAEDSQKVMAQHLRPGHRREIGLPLTKYLESPFAFVLGSEIPRRQVVQFVANKLGGAHFDPKRDPRLELLDQLARTRIEAGGLPKINAVYVELQSIAESLASSGDAARFRDTFRRTPEPT